MYNNGGTSELVKANKQANTTLIYFSINDIDLDNRKIRGRYYNVARDQWEERIFRLPDVVYVRGGPRKKVRELLVKLDNLGVKKLNPIHGFDKGELYEKLSKNESLRHHLPLTRTFDPGGAQSMGEIRNAIQKLGKVYIKACQGRRGLQVMRVSKLPNGGYEYSYSVIDKLVRKRVKFFSSLQIAIKSFFGNKKFIVQKAIDLPRVNRNQLVDFRAELQRNKNGKIEIVAVPMRVGLKNSPITTHASAYRYENYLGKIFPQYPEQRIRNLIAKIRGFLIDVYVGVEKEYGKFGEIGIDFAVDSKGKIWLIECNAQSAKVSIRKAYGEETMRKIYSNPLEYAKTLVRNGSRGAYRNRRSGRRGSD